MTQATSFISGEFEHCFSARGEAQWAGDNTISSSNNKLNSRTNRIELHTKVAQHRGRNAPVLTRKAEQEVFSADVIVLEALSLLPRKSQDPSGTHSERLKPVPVIRSEERRVGKSVDLGGRRIIKKKISIHRYTMY